VKYRPGKRKVGELSDSERGDSTAVFAHAIYLIQFFREESYIYVDRFSYEVSINPMAIAAAQLEDLHHLEQQMNLQTHWQTHEVTRY
jgi:hypothetical protein